MLRFRIIYLLVYLIFQLDNKEAAMCQIESGSSTNETPENIGIHPWYLYYRTRKGSRKKRYFLVARPLRGGGGKGRATKNFFFKARNKISEKKSDH